MNVGQAEVIDTFFLEVAAAPNQVRELVLVSPFVQLSSKKSKAGKRLCSLLSSVNAAGGTAILISDDTPARRNDFQKALQRHPKLAGTLFFHKDLHAKCGLATNSVGNQVAFMGSANLTDAGLNRNAEIVLGMKGRASEGQGWHMVGQLRSEIERIRANSSQLQHN